MIPAPRNLNLSPQAKSTKSKEIPIILQWLWQQNPGCCANEVLMKLLRETETDFLEIGLIVGLQDTILKFVHLLYVGALLDV